MEAFTYETGKYRYVAFDGCQWVVVFYHNIKKENAFAEEAEAKYSLKKYKYSILQEINDDFKFNGTHFEFMLYYKEQRLKYRRRQLNNPTTEEETKDKQYAEGFELIYPDTSKSHNFGGIVKATLPGDEEQPVQSYLDGNPGKKHFLF